MARVRVQIKTSATKELEPISTKKDRQRIARRIAALGAALRPRGCEKLADGEERYRVRQGRYRVVYLVDDTERAVEVFKIGHRLSVYR